MSRPAPCGKGARAEEDEAMSTNGELYEKDFYAWTQETAALIAAGKWHEIDQALLADEVAGLGRDDQREIVRRVQCLLKELLLWWALPGERKGNWASAILEERARLEDIVRDSPSLKAQLGEVMAAEYRWARSKAQDQTLGYVFPEACPFTVAQVLDDDFLPEGSTLAPPSS
jgi:hypothetical protein